MPEYTGTDNLEVMAEAIKYNQYLINAVSYYLKKDSKIIDFGAGSGTFAKALKDQGYSITCVEPDSKLAQHLRENGFKVLHDLRSDIEPVDVIYSLNVLEHIENDVEAMEYIFKSLKPNGVAIIYVPALKILFTSMDEKVGHFRRYHRNELIEKMQTAGFIINSAKYVDTLGFLATLAYKLLGSKNGNISKKSIAIYDKYIFPASLFIDKITFHRGGKNILLYARKK